MIIPSPLKATLVLLSLACSSPSTAPRAPETSELTAPAAEPPPAAEAGPAASGDADLAGGPPTARSSPPAEAAAAASADLPQRFALLLEWHNRARAEHCAPPLTWSTELAAYAQEWADQIRASGCSFSHRPGNRHGENLAAFGPPGSGDGASITRMWVDERKLYDFDAPRFSMKTGHFTQVVWRSSRRVGCGTTTCQGMEIWVCNYDPPGNVDGEYRAQVLPRSCRQR